MLASNVVFFFFFFFFSIPCIVLVAVLFVVSVTGFNAGQLPPSYKGSNLLQI